MVQPTIQLLLDDASNGGTFPYDITSFVRLTDGVDVARGRGNEYEDIQPSTFSATLENTDGRFTVGSTSGGYGAINVDRQIRYKVTANAVTTTRFTGFVQAWPVEWPDGGGTFAVAQITAIDELARLSRKTLRSIIEEEILLDSPNAYYTLEEPAGATTAGDSSGTGGAPLAQAGSGISVVFGTATGPGTDGLTAATFAAGKGLRPTTAPAVTPTAITIECFFTASTDGYLIDTDGNGFLHSVFLAVNAGKLRGLVQNSAGSIVIVDSPGSVTDGLVHHAALVSANGGPTTLYLDGAAVASSAVAVTLDGFTITTVGIQALADAGAPTGSIAHVARTHTALSASRIAAHAAAGLTGFAGEPSGQRIARLASYASVASPVLGASANTSVPFVDITGASPLAAISEVDKAEGGTVFIRGDGRLVMQSRWHRTLQTAPDLTLTNNDIDPGCRLVADMQLVQNIVTASAGANGAVQVAANAASRAIHGDYPADLTGLLVATDELALNAAQWRVTQSAEPAKRMPNLGLDLATLPATTQASVMAVEISDRIQVVGWPSQAQAAVLDLYVEGWTESLSADSWTWEANTSNRTVSGWLLDDLDASVLDTSTTLFY